MALAVVIDLEDTASAMTEAPLLVGFRVRFAADVDAKAPFLVLDQVFDQKTGKYELLLVEEDTGRLTQVHAHEVYVLDNDVTGDATDAPEDHSS